MDIFEVKLIEVPDLFKVSIITGTSIIVNSNGTYNAVAYNGQTFVIPDTPWTDSDGTPMTSPATTPIVCSAPVGCDVENSDGTYDVHVNNGDTLVLPDTTVKNTAGTTILTQPSATSTGVIADSVVTNSDNTFSLNVPAETNPVLANITHIDSDGTPVVYPSAKAFTCTPAAPVIVGEQFYIQFPAYYKNFIDVTIDATSAGTYVDEVLTNVASVIYTVNTIPVTIPFTVVNGDVLGLTITKTDYSCLALVELTNESISPYMFNSVGYISVYPPAYNATYVKATTMLGSGLDPYLATDPTKLLTGNYSGTSWLSSSATNQRFHIDLGSAKAIGRIYYENTHTSGANTLYGCKNFTLWGSNSASDFADLTYANDGTWTQITGLSQSYMEAHISNDTADPKYIIVPNTTAYRYYALKFADNHGGGAIMGVRRIELQE